MEVGVKMELKSLQNVSQIGIDRVVVNRPNVSNLSEAIKVDDIGRKIALSDIALLHVQEITFEEKAPSKEAVENVVSSLQIPGAIFVYIIQGSKDGSAKFYFGLAKDKHCQRTEMDNLSITQMMDTVLEPSIIGNFRGSKLEKLDNDEIDAIQSSLVNADKNNGYPYCAWLQGVPGIVEDNEKFQSVDRLISAMGEEEYSIVILGKPVAREDVFELERNLQEWYTRLFSMAKQSLQLGQGTSTTEGSSSGSSTTESTSKSKGISVTTSKSNSDSSSRTRTTGTNEGHSTGKNKSTSQGSSSGGSSNSTNKSGTEGSHDDYSHGKSTSDSDGTTHSESNSESKGATENDTKSKTKGTNEGKTSSTGTSANNAITVDVANKSVQSFIDYFDNILFKRLDYGKGKGLFLTSISLFAKQKTGLIKLENAVRSLYSGEEGNRYPFKREEVGPNSTMRKSFANFQIPTANLSNCPALAEESYSLPPRSLYSDNKLFYCANWMSTNELSLIAGLPQKEVMGLRLKEEIDFGLNYTKPKGNNKIELGSLVQAGNIRNAAKVSLDKTNLDKHTFITGVTGSGKTTTCQKILLKSDLPFMVIEPAKTEYRILATDEALGDVLVFTLGDENACPFRLNPFEFIKGESITSRVDMLKATFEASFDMEAAIPQLIEASMYRCYEDYGWDIATSTNYYFEDPFAPGVFAFPTMSDLLMRFETIVDEQGFDVRLKNDYLGSLRARVQSLTVGAKGFMLNTPRSVSFEKLITQKIVLELEDIRNVSEKSLIMGFVLVNLMEAIKRKCRVDKKPYRHITVVEEAHRLLSKYVPGDSMNKKQSVETFADMLAEVRKYGESLIIADQIPSKLTPEVLKNTNTKIVHKLFAKDDKDAIGNAMILDEDQKNFLSNLEPGRAVVSTQGWSKAVQVQIERLSETERPSPEDDKLREQIIKYYCSDYASGVFPLLSIFGRKPTVDEAKELIGIDFSTFAKSYQELVLCSSDNIKRAGRIVKRGVSNKIIADHLEGVAEIIFNYCYIKDIISKDISHKDMLGYIKELLKSAKVEDDPICENKRLAIGLKGNKQNKI